jgi:hypothetical protein
MEEKWKSDEYKEDDVTDPLNEPFTHQELI